MKYGILFLIIVAALLLLRSQLYSQDTPDGADQEELEMLKRAWKRHKQEKEDENPGGLGSEHQNPLGTLEDIMRAIERRLTREDPGTATQEKQREVLRLLDELIEQFTPRQPGPGSSSAKDDKSPPGGGAPRPGSLVDPSQSHQPAEPGAEVKKELLKKARKDNRLEYGPTGKRGDWNPALPGNSKLRDLESDTNDKCPPRYRELVRRYFKKLMDGLTGR